MNTFSPDLTLGEPQVAGPLAVFPVLGPDPELDYRAFAQAAGLGAFVKELDGGASVGRLLLSNPTDKPLLVYEGEEVLGAQQNRTFDISVLVAAGAQVQLPVSCVEAGRWDGSRAAEHFEPAPQAADPSLRALKRVSADREVAAGRAAKADQGMVWDQVDERIGRHNIASASGAMSDVYDQRRSDLHELTAAVSHVDGQVGAVATVAGRPVVLDLVSRADVFASLLPRLAQGYALDSLGASAADPDSDGAAAFLDKAIFALVERVPTPGIGRGLRVVEPGLVGSGIEHEDALVQLCAFPADRRPDATPVAADGVPIARPSRRRRRT